MLVSQATLLNLREKGGLVTTHTELYQRKKSNPVMRREPATFDPYASIVPAHTTGDHFQSKGSLPTVLVTKPENLEFRWWVDENLSAKKALPYVDCELKMYY